MVDVKYSILIVDDERSNIHILFQTLKHEYSVTAAVSGELALEKARAEKPDLILLDIIMPDMSGHEVMTKLRETNETCNIPVIFVTGLDSSRDEVEGLYLGAVDYITKPLNIEVIKARVNTHINIIKQMRAIEQQGMTDAVTELANRRRFDQQLYVEWARSIRDQIPLGLLMLDIDKFKSYNDTYGHPAGDMVLKAVAKTIEEQIMRPADLAARIGGEEFAIILPNTDHPGAVTVGERIREAVEALRIPSGYNPELPVTVSIGVRAIIPNSSSVIADFVEAADKYLYTAKESGRNRVCS